MKKEKECTFFPADWQPNQVMDAIYEALEDYARTLEVDFRNDTIITGKSKQGIKIYVVLNNQQTILTAYSLI